MVMFVRVLFVLRRIKSFVFNLFLPRIDFITYTLLLVSNNQQRVVLGRICTSVDGSDARDRTMI